MTFRYWRAWLAGLALIFSAALARSQETPTPQPEPGPVVRVIDCEQEIAEDLDKYIREAREAWQVPGLAVAIVKDGRVLLSQGYGVKRVDGEEPVDQHTLFAIASNSKAFTAAALAMLVDEGKLRWDDRVRQHLPWFEMYDDRVAHDLRIRDLLCHRSGLGTFSGDLLWYGTPYSPREILSRATHLKPEGPFRAHYGYSNLMYLAAGEVIAAVSGQTWSDFVEQRMLGPLEMTRTVTSVRDLVEKENYATPHKTLLDGSRPIAWVNWDSMAAAGGLISSVDDMSRWLQAQLQQGGLPDGGRLFSPAASHEMWSAQMALKVSARSSQRSPSTHFRAYGLGWSLSDYKGRKLIGHGGGYDGMYSQVMLVPEESLGIVVLTNSMTSLPDSIVYRALDRFLGGDIKDWSRENLEEFRKSRVEFRARIDRAIAPVKAGTQPSHDLADYAGTYHSELYGDVVVTHEDSGLVLRLAPNPLLVADLTHLHYDTFVIKWRNEVAWFEEGSAHFVANARGEFARLELDVPNDDLWFYELDLVRRK